MINIFNKLNEIKNNIVIMIVCLVLITLIYNL